MQRLDTIRKLGAKCVRCGCEDLYVLQLDHSGKKFQRSSDVYEAVIKDGLPAQVLCANCKFLKEYWGITGKLPRNIRLAQFTNGGVLDPRLHVRRRTKKSKTRRAFSIRMPRHATLEEKQLWLRAKEGKL